LLRYLKKIFYNSVAELRFIIFLLDGMRLSCICAETGQDDDFR
jgi:hypothetical protein